MESLDQLKKELIKCLRDIYYRGGRQIKVRYGPEGEKFYLDWVDDGSYESSLWSLIHKIMYHEGIYKKFLNDRCMADLEVMFVESPDGIYKVNEDDFTDEEEANGYTYELIQETYLDGLYDAGISFIGDQLNKNK